MTEQHLIALGHYRDAAKSFNYFVTGGSATLLTYLVQHWSPTRFEANPESLEFLGIVFLALSVFCGFRTLEDEVEALRNNFAMLQTGSQLSQMTKAVMGGGYLVTPEGPISGAQAATLIPSLQKQKDDSERAARECSEAGALVYRWRNYFLFLGSLAYISSRVVPAYL